VPIRDVQQGTFEREFQLVDIKEPERTVATIKARRPSPCLPSKPFPVHELQH
jgi:hypothetical protein